MDNVVSFDQVLLGIRAKASFGAGQIAVEGSIQVGQFANRDLADEYAEAVKKLLTDNAEPTIGERRQQFGSEPLTGLEGLMNRRIREVLYISHSIFELPRSLGAEIPAISETESPEMFVENIPLLLADMLLEHVEWLAF